MSDQNQFQSEGAGNEDPGAGKISRRGFLRAVRNVILGGIVFSIGGWRYSKFERGWIRINRETFPIEGLPTAFSKLTIAHLSDLHFNTWMTPERFEDVVSMVNQVSPDVVLVTGDFIDGRTDLAQIPAYTDLLRKIAAPLGKFAVLGNHDHWRGMDATTQMMAGSGFMDLSNRTFRLDYLDESIYLCGLDSYMEGRQNLGKVIADLPEGETAILLVHEPDFADISALTGRFGLQLSGHSHGGQIYVPVYGPPVTPDFGRKYPRGRYQVGTMQLYTNRGIGMVEPYVRLNCRPEIALIRLAPGEM